MTKNRRPTRQQPDHLIPRRHSRRRKWRQRPARLLAFLGAGLAAAAAILLIHYIDQANQTRAEQAALRAVFRGAQPSAGPGSAASPSAEHAAGAAVTAAPSSDAPVSSPAPASGGRPAMAERFLPLMRKNRDVVGWLSYPGIPEMDFPIVQRDNVYYLSRDFSGRDNISGSVFLDGACQIWPRDENLILHGHNMKNGTMFGKLARLLAPETLRFTPFMRFSTLYSEATYVPYAVAVFSNDPGDGRYLEVFAPNFGSVSEKEAYVAALRQRSALALPTDMRETDQLLTLITCHGPVDTERLAVALRALRPGEDEAALKQAFLHQLARQ